MLFIDLASTRVIAFAEWVVKTFGGYMNDTLSTPRSYLSPDDIMEIATGFMRSRALLTAFELGVFSAIGDGSKGSEEVARRIKADPRATDRLMNALAAMKLLKKEDGLFANLPLASRFLVAGKPGYMAGLAHTADLWRSWSTLTEAVTKGTAVNPSDGGVGEDEWRDGFIAAMHYRAKWQASAVVELIDTTGVKRMLDVGGGSGAYSTAFARMREGLSSVVFDLPEIVPLAQGYIEEEGLAGKVTAVAGDYTKDGFGTGFDLVFLSAVIHSNSADVNRALLCKCRNALADGGQVVVQDFVMDEERKGPQQAAIFALNMLVNTRAGDTYTESEIRAWMMEASLSGIERKDTPFGTSLMIGRR